MSNFLFQRSTLTPDVERAVQNSLMSRLEDLTYNFDHDTIATMNECREAVQECAIDETLVMRVDMEQQVQLLEHYGDDFSMELGKVTFANLRRRIEGLSAWVVSSIAEQRALEVVSTIEELLREYGLDFENVKTSNSHEYFRHFDERDEYPWQVYEYRNLEGEGLHVDLFELTVGTFKIFVEDWLEQGSLTPEEESWDA